MINEQLVTRFWQSFLKQFPKNRKNIFFIESFSYGNTPELADSILAKVLSGEKTATSMLLWEFEQQKKTLWRIGDFSIALDGKGIPACVVQTTQLKIIPFNKASDEFIHQYGEGDKSRNWWDINMWEYYSDIANSIGKEPTRDMPLICEYFGVVYKANKSRFL